MIQDASRFSNFYDNVTTLHPIGAVMLVIALIAVFVVKRSWVFLPIIILTCLVPASQRVVIFSLDFHFLRLMTLAGWMRIWVRGESRPLTWTTLDKLVVWWTVAATATMTLRRASLSVFVYSLGVSFDAIGLYFLARVIIRDWRDLENVIRSFAIASIPVAYIGVQEIASGRNPFFFFGGVPEFVIVREGRVRLRGAFSHQILLGAYWAISAILCAALMTQRRRILIGGIGFLCSLFLVIASASSTPLMGLAGAAAAASLWPLRHRMRQVRWGIVAALLTVQLVMAKPIWHLYQRAAALGVGGSTGYHRYRLIDAFVHRFTEWAALGVNNTALWGRQLEDVTNHFVAQGVRSGLAGFLLFLAVFIYGYKQIGRIRSGWEGTRREALAWGLGVALVAQTLMMTSTSYFGQILLVLWVLFGAIGSLTPPGQFAGTRRVQASRRAKADGIFKRPRARIEG